MQTFCSGSGFSPRTMMSCTSELCCLPTSFSLAADSSRSLLIPRTQTDAQETSPLHVCLQHVLGPVGRLRIVSALPCQVERQPEALCVPSVQPTVQCSLQGPLQHVWPHLCVKHGLRGALKAALHCRLYTGDTESFRLAFHLAGKGADYAQAAHRPSAALSAQAAARGASKVSSWCRETICMGLMHNLSVILGLPALWQVYLCSSKSIRQGLLVLKFDSLLEAD